VQFSQDIVGNVISGDITVSFRLWQRPKVKAGGLLCRRPGDH